MTFFSGHEMQDAKTYRLINCRQKIKIPWEQLSKTSRAYWRKKYREKKKEAL